MPFLYVLMCMNSIWARDKNIQLACGIFSFKTFGTSGHVYIISYILKKHALDPTWSYKKIHKHRMIFVQGVVCNFPTSHPPHGPTGSHVIAYVGARGGVAFCRGFYCGVSCVAI